MDPDLCLQGRILFSPTSRAEQASRPPHAPGSHAEVVVGKREIVVLRKLEVLVQPLTVRRVSKTRREWKVPGEERDVRTWRCREGDTMWPGGGLGDVCVFVHKWRTHVFAGQRRRADIFAEETRWCQSLCSLRLQINAVWTPVATAQTTPQV